MKKKIVAPETIQKRRSAIAEDIELVGTEGIVYGDKFTRYAVAPCTEASEYYVLEAYKMLIPVCATAQDTLALFAAHKGDWDIPANIAVLPMMMEPAARVFIRHTKDWQILPVLQHVLTTKPVVTMSPMEEEAYREQKRRAASRGSAKLGRITMDIDIEW